MMYSHHEMTPLSDLPWIWASLTSRWAERDDRMAIIDAVCSGDLDGVGPDDEVLENRSPNLIQVAIEDTAESASLMPTFRAVPSKPTKGARDMAAAMERMAASYVDRSGGELLVNRSQLDLVAYGFQVWQILKDPESNLPYFERRDPRTCYPEAGFRFGKTVQRCLFTRRMHISQLPYEYREKIDLFKSTDPMAMMIRENTEITLVEYFTECETIIAVLYQPNGPSNPARGDYIPVELDRFENPGHICPVVIEQRMTLDGEPRGQMDQVVEPMRAHARLMAMAVDYADQSVYSDIWVKDPMGPIPLGGGGVIQLGPNGAIGRIAPAVSSMTLTAELEQLMNSIHLGGRWPKSRPGEIDQAIASAKFLESSLGVMNTAMRTLHRIQKRQFERALRIAFLLDSKTAGKKTYAGVLRNQQFATEFDTTDIDLKCQVKAEYGLGLGRDPAQSAVLHIQYLGAGLISKEFVQESIEGLNDLAREQRRIEAEKVRDMMMAKLMMGVEQGAIPEAALVEILKGLENGSADITALFEKFVVKPKEDAAATQVQPGLPGMEAMPPGAPPGPAGPTPPAAPSMPQMIGRLSVPLGNGSFAGTQVGG